MKGLKISPDGLQLSLRGFNLLQEGLRASVKWATIFLRRFLVGLLHDKGALRMYVLEGLRISPKVL